MDQEEGDEQCLMSLQHVCICGNDIVLSQRSEYVCYEKKKRVGKAKRRTAS